MLMPIRAVAKPGAWEALVQSSAAESLCLELPCVKKQGSVQLGKAMPDQEPKDSLGSPVPAVMHIVIPQEVG